jgi:hypothetical protein
MFACESEWPLLIKEDVSVFGLRVGKQLSLLFFEPVEFLFSRRDTVRSDELGFEGCEGL